MNMAKKKLGSSSRSYRRLGRQGEEEYSYSSSSSSSVPKGFVPIMVGVEATPAERVLVRVKKLKDPRVARLLQMAHDQLGCQPPGPLRLTCDADYFRSLLRAANS